MVKKTRRRLFSIFLVSTVSTFTLIILLFMYNDIQQEQQNNITFFENILLSLTYQIMGSGDIDAKVISDLEHHYNFLIHIYGFDYEYQSPNSATTSSIVFERLRNHVSSNLSIEPDQNESEPFTINKGNVTIIQGDSKDSYYGAICKIPYKNHYVNLELLLKQDRVKSIVKYLLIWFVIILFLIFLSFYLVKQALRPVITTMQQQKDFIAAVSHELKSPLAVIQASANMFYSFPDHQKQFINNIVSESERMSKLISDLLFLASGDSVNWTMNKEELYLDNILIEVYTKFLSICNQELELILPESTFPLVWGNDERLKQLFSILIDNAISYSLENSKITIKADVLDKCIVVEIIDHGAGISDVDKEKVFERFYRSDQSRTSKNHFGLGLSIAYEIIDAHKGAIRLEDTEGGGCTVVISFAYKRI